MLYTPAYLTGGTDAEDTAATWAALAATGKFSMTINGTARTDISPDFTGCTTMALVAAAIQTAIRAKTSSTETVTWSTDHFIITSVDTSYTSAVGYATSPTTGTDISGAGTDDWMDCDTGNATLTAVSASLGMTLDDIYDQCALELFDDSTDTTMDANWFRVVLNEGYREVLDKLDQYNPNWALTNGTTFDITASSTSLEQTFSLTTYAPGCVTIERVDYVDDDADYDDDTTPIPETEYDEKETKTGLRWYRKGDNIVFRGVIDDVDNVTIRYIQRKEALIAATDRPTFPMVDDHIILVHYVVAMWFKKEKMEVDWKEHYQYFQDRLARMLNRQTPTDDPKILRVMVDNGMNDLEEYNISS